MENKPATKTETARIEELVAVTNTPKDILAEAVKQRAEEQRQRDIATAKDNLANVEYYIQNGVTTLRSARATAKRAEDNLLKLSRAAESFKKGEIDYNEFSIQRHNAGF